MGRIADAGVPPRDASLPAGVRGIENKSIEKKGIDSRTTEINTKGLWLYTADKRIGLYSSTDEWDAVLIGTVAEKNESGFALIVKRVKKYYDSTGMKRIPKLAFAVHGDVKGVVEISNNKKNIPSSEIGKKEYEFMSPFTIYYFLGEINKLNQYLAENAQVIFYSCMAGYGAEGSYLLEQVSGRKGLPGKTVIAFTTLAESGVSRVGTPAAAKPAGIVYETGETVSYDRNANYPVRKPNSDYSKHARNGTIIRPAKLPLTEKKLPFFRPERKIYIRKNLFDLLYVDKHLYYLSIMLIGWYVLDKQNKFRGAVRTKDAIDADYLEGLRIIRTDERYLGLKKQGLPKDYKQTDGVWVVHETDIPKTSYQLDDKRKKQYGKLKGTLTSEFQNDVPVIWRNNGANKNKINAYIDAMLQLSIGRRVPSSTINAIGKSEFNSVFNKPGY